MEINVTIFLQIFFFLTLLLWLSRSLFSPIIRLFDEREKRIDGAREQALRLSGLADQKALTFDHEYEKARVNARQALTHIKNVMEKDHMEALERTKAQARDKVEKALNELSAQENIVRKQLAGTSESLADDLVNILLRRST